MLCRQFGRWPWLPYTAPFALSILLTAVEPSTRLVSWPNLPKTPVVGGEIRDFPLWNACVVAHDVPNLVVGRYVLRTGHWSFRR